jgi:hypothetical protein
MTWYSAGSFDAERSCQDEAHQTDCPCPVGGDPVYRRVEVTERSSTFLGFRGEVREVLASGDRMVRLDGFYLDLPFGHSEITEVRPRAGEGMTTDAC